VKVDCGSTRIIRVPCDVCDLFFEHYAGDQVGRRMCNKKRVWEEKLLQTVWEKHLDKNSVVLDAGGNFGASPVWLSKHVRRVYTVEANWMSYKLLVANLARNGCVNVVPIWAALWDKSGNSMRANEPDHTLGGTEIAETSDGSRPIALSVKIDDLPIEGLSWINLDIEGNELRALRGATETLKRDHPLLTVECHIREHSTHIDAESASVTYEKVMEIVGPLGYMRGKDCLLHVPGAWGD